MRRRERPRVAARSIVTEKLTDEPSDAQTILGIAIDPTLALEGQTYVFRGGQWVAETPAPPATEGGVAGSHASTHAEGGSDDLVSQNINVSRVKIEDTGTLGQDLTFRVIDNEMMLRNSSGVSPRSLSVLQFIFRDPVTGVIRSRLWGRPDDYVEVLKPDGVSIGNLRATDIRALGVAFLQDKIELSEITAPAGDPAANKGWLYGKDVGGQTKPHWESEDGTVTDLTAGGGGGGHTIEENGTPLTARTVLNFQDGVIASDDGTETDVNIDYATTAEIADVAATEAAGTSAKVPRGDHVHAHTAAAHTSLALYSIVEYVFTADEAPNADIDAGIQSLYLHSGPVDETFVRMYGDVVTPAGTALTVSLQYGDTDDLDTVATWTTINTLAFATSKSPVPNDTSGTLPANRLIRLNITTVSGTAPRGLTVSLRCKRKLST